MSNEFALSGKFDGTNVTGARWVRRLNKDLQNSGHTTPSDFFEAVDILFEGKAAVWLDSSPRWKPVTENLENATTKDVENFKKALDIQFKGISQDVPDTSLQSEIRNLSQGNDESLQSYYQRTQDLIVRGPCRDQLLAGSGDEPLNKLETLYWSNIVTSFIEGLASAELRKNLVLKDVDTYCSLYRAYKEILSTQNNMKKLKEIEARAADRRELEQYRAMYNQGKPMSAGLAELNHATAPPYYSPTS
ncbi:hypothetical protein PZA11_003903 [Diplocarpon coronariae]